MLSTLNHLSARVACHLGIRAGRVDVTTISHRIGAAFGGSMAPQEYRRLAVAYHLYRAACDVDRRHVPALEILDPASVLTSRCLWIGLPTPFTFDRTIHLSLFEQERGRFAYIPAPQHKLDLCRSRIADAITRARQHGLRLVTMRYERPGQTRERLVFEAVPAIDDQAAWIERRLADTLSLNPALYDWTFGHKAAPEGDWLEWQ